MCQKFNQIKIKLQNAIPIAKSMADLSIRTTVKKHKLKDNVMEFNKLPLKSHVKYRPYQRLCRH